MTSRQSALLLLAAKLRVMKSRKETAVHAAADRHLAAMKLAVLYAFMQGRKAYKSGGAKAAVKAVRDGILKAMPSVLGKALAAGGAAGVSLLKQHRQAMRALAKPVAMRFDATSPEAIVWAQQHAGELADSISETTEQAIKDATAAALEGEGIDAAYDKILAAVGDDARAEMIARTEVMDAANEGLAQSWSQAQEEGLLPADAKKEWIATSDACPECEEVDGEVVPIDDDFSVGDDPPLHPNCRCTMGIAAS